MLRIAFRFRFAPMALATVLLLSSVARAEIIWGIIGKPAATMSNAMGWNNAAPVEDFIFSTACEGEPIRVYWTVDDDADEVQTCTVVIKLIERKSGKTLKTWHPATRYRQGRQHFDILPGGWKLKAGFGEGLYDVKIKATVATPVAERGEDEVEWATIYLYKQKKWNIVAMISGDNSLSSAVKTDLEEMDDEDSTKDANYIVLYDESGNGDTNLIRIKYNWDSSAQGIHLRNNLIPANRELNTGSQATATAFLRWVHANHPADRWMVLFWDHGDGIRSHNHDDRSGSAMTLARTRGALNSLRALRGRSIDIMAFDECLMSMMEVGYEFRGVANYLIASQRTEGNSGWHHEAVLDVVTSNPAISVEGYVKALVANGRNSSSIKTIAGIRLNDNGSGKMDVVDLAKSLNSLAGTLLTDAKKCPEKIAKARVESGVTDGQNANANQNSNTYVDLYDYLDRLQKATAGKARTISNKAGATKTLFKKVLVAEYSPAYPKHNGLSIYYPEHFIRQGANRNPSKYYPSPKQAVADAANLIPFNNRPVNSDYIRYRNNTQYPRGADGGNWYTWIKQDLVPPKVHAVKMWQIKPDGSQVVTYDKPNPTAPRNSHDAHEGELHIKVQFNEEMDATQLPPIRFGLDEPFEDFTFAGPGTWSKTTRNNDTWTGKITLPPDPKKLDGLHTLKIDATDAAGNKIDENWTKEKRQLDESNYFSVRAEGLPYLAALSARQQVQGKGKVLFYVAYWNNRKTHRAFVPDRKHKFINTGKKGGDVEIVLSFRTKMDGPSIAVDVGPAAGLGAVPLNARAAKEGRLWKVPVPIARIREAAKSGKPLKITVRAQSATGFKLDARPSSFPEFDMKEKKWKQYETARTSAGAQGETGGPDTWHRFNFIGSSTLILMDVSGSMNENGKLVKAKEAATQAVEALKENSEVAILTFSNCGAGSTRVTMDFTTDRAALTAAIKGIRAGGGTPLASAILFGKRHLEENARSGIQNFILLSDGQQSCGKGAKAPLGAIKEFKEPPKEPTIGGKTP